jgi:type I restriction enzyme S subunit
MEKGEQIYKLPEGWIETSIDVLAVVLTGNTPSKKYLSYYGGNLPFCKPSDLNTGIVYRAKEHLSDEGRAVARTLPKDSVLVTSIGATIGKTGLIKKEGAFDQQINGIIPFVSFPLFYYYQILEGSFQRRIVENSSATTVPIINKSKFGKLKLNRNCI